MKNKIIVTEGVHGNWHYHLSMEESFVKSLCGKWVMKTNLPIDAWGTVTHLNEKYCKECLKVYEEMESAKA